jgi:hypothetical protein
MMLDVAETLDPLLDARARRVEQGELDLEEDEDAAETTLQLIFFDGEEAFISWTDSDSIYGAKYVPIFPSPTSLHPSPGGLPTHPSPHLARIFFIAREKDTSPKYGRRPTSHRTPNAV